ncbi:16S rRNA processing protein RimM, partial [Crocinitomix catalasitica]|nr:16S rRNA processing protein RimM [Crocinitomix catalasitica]
LHSFKGEVSIYLDVDDPQDYKELESVFVEFDGKLIPFFLEQIQLKQKNFAVVKFEDIEREEQAKKLVKCDLYLPKTALPKLKNDEYYFFEIENFAVVDELRGEIGKVIKVVDLSGNPLIQVDFKGAEILIPKQDNFVKSIDWDEKIIHISAPEGLIEMYIGEEE